MMDTVTPFTPTPGAAAPGNLYADLGTRTLWLGVDAAVDPSQAVLISDILGLGADIDQCLVDAKAYTNTQVATRALTSHTHTASQITDFNAAVTAIVTATPSLNWVRGMIMQWSGSLASIGVGTLAGWGLCDGTNGTPNLRDKFIIGAGNKAPGSVNPLATVSTTDDGAHTPIINAMSLSVAQMPAHTHAVSVTGTGSGSTTTDGSHTHVILGSITGVTPAGLVRVDGGANNANQSTVADGAHNHDVTTTITGSGTAASQGSGAGHTHTAPAIAAHHHTLTSTQVRDVLPYYALAFIMKL